MAFRVTAGETAEQAIRRIASEQIDGALRDLDDDGLDEHETVHEVRKRCKKIRGLLRLARPSFEDTYRAENARFRDAARRLSDLRDATTLLECLDALLDRYDDRVDRGRFAGVREELERRRTALAADQGLDDRLGEVAHAMQTARNRVGSWSIEDDGFAAVAGGIGRTYRRARRAMRAAARQPSTERLHEWRKRVKYHRYHCRLLSELWPAPLEARRDEAKRLSDLLGDDHDLAVLRETVLDQPDRFGGVAEVANLLALIEARRGELQGWSLPLGERLFAEKPRRFVARLEPAWQAFHVERVLASAFGEGSAAVYS